MRTIVFLLCAAVSASLLGCAAAAPQTTTPSAAGDGGSGSVAAPAAGATGEGLEMAGAETVLPAAAGRFTMEAAFRHVPSGVAFPLRVASLQRGVGYRYSTDKEDFSFSYQAEDRDRPLLVTAYVYPVEGQAPTGTDEERLEFLVAHLEGAVQALHDSYTDVVVVDAAAGELPSSATPLLWLAAEFTYVQEGNAQTSWTWVTVHGSWYIKLRMTAPTAYADEARAIQEQFPRELSKLVSDAAAR